MRGKPLMISLAVEVHISAPADAIATLDPWMDMKVEVIGKMNTRRPRPTLT